MLPSEEADASQLLQSGLIVAVCQALVKFKKLSPVSSFQACVAFDM